ncbi:hypothetical protein HG530_008477 [Fusarium avenaceum]|nr:hypothetical protein HG530_008477 [Fusarium avenaceum]
MKVALFFSALLSAQVLAIPEPDNTVIKDGEYTYTGIDKSAVGQAQTAPQANASVLGTMVAGLAVVVACSASQDLAQEYAGLSKHGHPT